MMKIKSLLMIAIATALLASCKSISYTESTIRTTTPPVKSIVTPVALDLEVEQTQVTYTAHFENNLTKVDVLRPKASATLESMKAQALLEAVQAHNANVIVAPNFDITTSEDGKTVNVTVKGFPARYVNLRKATLDDITLYDSCKTIIRNEEYTLSSTLVDAAVWNQGPKLQLGAGLGLLYNTYIPFGVNFAYNINGAVQVGVGVGCGLYDNFLVGPEVSARVYCTNPTKKVRMFIDAELGYNKARRDYVYDDYYYGYGHYVTKWGLSLNAMVGAELRGGLSAKMGLMTLGTFDRIGAGLKLGYLIPLK